MILIQTVFLVIPVISFSPKALIKTLNHAPCHIVPLMRNIDEAVFINAWCWKFLSCPLKKTQLVL